MQKRKWVITAIASVAVMALLIGMYYYIGSDGKSTTTRAISVIVYGNDSERWENLRSGAEQAADMLSAEINLVTMPDETNAEEQKKLLRREIDNGADALMVAACDSDQMRADIEAFSTEIPILMIESGIGYSDHKLTISADNYMMGHRLGDTLVANEMPEVKVAIINDHGVRDSVAERYQGVYDSLNGKVDSVVIWGRKDNEQDIRSMLFLQRELTEEAVDVVVALDTSSTEAIIDAVENLGKNVKIYGIGNSDKAIYYLDNETIEALGYQNEYSIGYLGVQQLMEAVQYSNEDYQQLIEYQVVTKNNLYETSNQKMLFPFVK